MTAPSVLPYCMPYLVPLMTIWGQYSAHRHAPLLPIVFVWVLVPLLDLFFARAAPPPPPLSAQQRIALESRVAYRAVVWLWAPTQLVYMYWAASRATSPDITVSQLACLVLASGLVGAGGTNCAHELLHRRSSWEVRLAELLLCSVCYGHFVIEHAQGHHRRVATLDDPATLRFGESFYAFLPRTVFGGLQSAWDIEAKRLRRLGCGAFSMGNAVLRYAAASIAMLVALAVILGPMAALFAIATATVAVTLLEQVNAIEHYGLMRDQNASGKYEPVGAQHSWDTDHVASNFLLFKLQNHADHHLRTLPSLSPRARVRSAN